ncbi:MAG: type II toxin-antitoxin system HicB family antitoxin [Bryobacteraceae bacterium]
MTNHGCAIVLEKTGTGWSAYAPDLDGCIATGSTPDETRQLMREALELHLRAMREEGDEIPAPTSLVEYAQSMISTA